VACGVARRISDCPSCFDGLREIAIHFCQHIEETGMRSTPRKTYEKPAFVKREALPLVAATTKSAE
jgi:hypothetical protein